MEDLDFSIEHPRFAGTTASVEPAYEPWLALRTKSRQERLVERELRQKTIHNYLPTRCVTHRWKDRRKIVEEPLFRGYVFVRPRLDQYDSLRFIPGSCGLVRTGQRIAAMPERDLEAVRIMVDSGATLQVEPTLVLGQRVRVQSGPLAGVEGELVRIRNEQRLVINAQLINSCVSVEVDVAMVVAL